MTRRAPGPIALVTGAACALAFGTDQPLVLGALALGGLALLLTARAPHRLYLAVGLATAVGLVILNPLLARNGNLILFEGPEIPILDTQVTLEEVVAGLAAGLRALAVTLLVGAFLGHVDPERLQAVVARVLPRSALACVVAARLVPALERDGRQLAEAARLRGLALSAGPRRARARTASRLMLPLAAAGLERSLDLAEAMAARGYGTGPPSRLPEPAYCARERALLGLGLALTGAAVVSLTTGLGTYRFFPTLEPLALAPALLASAVGALLGAAATVAR